MEKTRSKDGTAIAFSRIGRGPVLVLVDGALCHRAFGPSTPLARELESDFTVVTYDRRGRGDSDPAAYGADSVDREVEDLEAVVKAAGAPAHLLGISSGAALALEAVRRGVAVEKLVLFEAPFIVDGSRPPVPDDYVRRLQEAIAAGRNGVALKIFMREGVRVPGVFVFMMSLSPVWSKLKAIAPTLLFDAAVVVENEQGQPLPAARWAEVRCPTLVVDGGKSPAWMRNAMAALAAALPNARPRTLPGQTHMIDAGVLGPVVAEFLSASN
jgi:pimeloyl-ACP methyl ester carboxylesterase